MASTWDIPSRPSFREAERLDEFRREAIERAFRTKVFNYYGCREFGTIAVECGEHNGLHMNFEQLYAEIAEDRRALVTSFMNLGTVFIRYEIGDSAEGVLAEACRCGRHSHRLQRSWDGRATTSSLLTARLSMANT